MNTNVFGIKGLTDDDEISGTHFHYDAESMHMWTAKTHKEYRDIEKRIDKIGKKTKAFEVYAWCDISGFDYWVKKQEEPNYIQISVVLKKKNLSPIEIKALKRALEDAECDACNIEYETQWAVADLYKKEGAQ